MTFHSPLESLAGSPKVRRTLAQWLLAAAMFTGIYVKVEPAPFDLAIVATGIVLLATRSLKIPHSSLPAIFAVLVFGLANGLSLILTSDPSRAYGFLAITVYLMLAWGVVVAAQGHGGSRATDAMLSGYAVGGAVAAGTGIAAYVGVPVISAAMVPDGRLYGLFKDANVYGAYLVPVAIVALAKLIGRTSEHRLFWVATFAMSVGAVFLSFSRGAWVNLAIALAVFLVLFSFADGFSRTWWRMVLLFPPVLAMLAVLAYQLLSLEAVSDMFSIRFGMQGYDDLRFSNQADAFATALHHPLGLGPGSTETLFTTAAHSTYVRALVENGLLGALSLVGLMVLSGGRALWFAVASESLEHRLRFAVIAAALCGMYVEAAVIDTVHWRHFWIVMALAWCPAPFTRSAGGRPRSRPQRNAGPVT